MARILVLEDDADLASFLQISLEGEGHYVEICNDARLAVARFGQADFNVFLADIIVRVRGAAVPDGGITAIAQIRTIAAERGTDLSVIAMSGAYVARGMENILTIASSIGADYTLAKPFSPDTLLDLITKIESPAGKTPG